MECERKTTSVLVLRVGEESVMDADQEPYPPDLKRPLTFVFIQRISLTSGIEAPSHNNVKFNGCE